MKKTDFSRHTVADLRHWQKSGHLEIQPDYQRRSVWTPAARVMLIDSILEGIPLPKIFISSSIKSGNTHKRVIDGQQRTTAILDFLDDKFPLSSPYKGRYSGKTFKELPETIQNKILSYRIDFNEFEDYTDDEIREIYNRVNKYTVALNKQELRRADYPGDFLELSEQLSNHEFLEDSKIFTLANRRRMHDVEYCSELLAVLIDGIQDKKGTLDEFYISYAKWPKKEIKTTTDQFHKVIGDLQEIFAPNIFPIHTTRFKQKSDFYSLFSATYEVLTNSHSIHSALLPDLREDLLLLDRTISPDAPSFFGEYAIRCVSDANSRSSREWRKDFIKNFLVGAYDPDDCGAARLELFATLERSFDSGMCPPRTDACPICDDELEEYDKDAVLSFPKGRVFLTTSRLMHRHCFEKSGADWVIFDGS